MKKNPLPPKYFQNERQITLGIPIKAKATDSFRLLPSLKTPAHISL